MNSDHPLSFFQCDSYNTYFRSCLIKFPWRRCPFICKARKIEFWLKVETSLMQMGQNERMCTSKIGNFHTENSNEKYFLEIFINKEKPSLLLLLLLLLLPSYQVKNYFLTKLNMYQADSITPDSSFFVTTFWSFYWSQINRLRALLAATFSDSAYSFKITS